MQDFESARDSLEQLSSNANASSLTAYLLFKVAIRMHSDEKVLDIVDRMVSAADFQAHMLYHCALEAQELKKPRIALGTLTIIVGRAQNGQDRDKVRIPALLR